MTVPPLLRGPRRRLAYLAASALLNTPLRRFGFRTPKITRFDTMEEWTADRLAEVAHYRELFGRFTGFGGKTVLDLGCNRGYLLDAFLRGEEFEAVGADISEGELEEARRAYGRPRPVRPLHPRAGAARRP